MARFPEPAARLFFADPPPSDDIKLETGDLKAVEILAAGTWTTMAGKEVTFTRHDLRQIADTYDELSEKVKPAFKLGHISDAEQKLATGAPALGWLTNVRVKGDKLVADIVKVPKKVLALIEAGSYRRISAEIARGWTDGATGKVHDMVLTAAGLLGAAAPAISTLKDVMNLYGRPALGELPAVELISLADFIPAGGNDMDPKELKALVDAAVTDALKAQGEQFAAPIRAALGIDATADPVVAITTLKAENQKAAEAAAKAASDKFASDRDALIAKAKQEGKLLPADEPAVKLMVDGWGNAAKDGKLEFAVGEKKIAGTVLECLSQYLDARPVVARIGRETGTARVEAHTDAPAAKVSPDVLRFAAANPSPVPFDRQSMDRDAAVREYMREHKGTDYYTAFHIVNGLIDEPVSAN